MRSRRPQEKIEPDTDAELVHSIMADIHARMNEIQIRKLVKALQIELTSRELAAILSGIKPQRYYKRYSKKS